MPYISLRGVEHYYEWLTTAGTVPTGKPAIVFLHGWAGSARYWESTAQALSNRFDCLLYDMRGFGRSRLPLLPTPETAALTYDLETYADDLAELLQALGLERVILNAHSTGASIAKLFNTYKFADYKEHVIELLQRVCTVSVKTMEIIQQMPDTVEHQSLD